MGPKRTSVHARSIAALSVLLVPALGAPASAAPEDVCRRFEGGGSAVAVVDFSELDGTVAQGGDPASLRMAAELALDLRIHSGQFSDDCDGSTLQNTDQIFVQGTDGPNAFTLDQGGGSFGSIPFSISLGGGDDAVNLLGTNDRDVFTAHHYTNGVSAPFLGLGGNPNMGLEQVERVGMTGLGGIDWMGSSQGVYGQRSAAAGGTFGHIQLPLTVDGGGGKDGIAGGTADDTLLGGGGNDKLNGGDGDDSLKGGGGKDRLVGGKGKDKTNGGGGGKDTCKGGPGKDKERGCE